MQSLDRAGYDVWTPTEMDRYPGKRAKRPIPVMPTYLFARADRLLDLLELSESPCLPVTFSLFRYFQKIPLIADDELQALRRYEAKAAPKESWPTFNPRDEVTATDGPYCGLGGKVVRSKGEWALVMFGWQKVKISTFILQPTSHISDVRAQQRAAA